MLGNDVAFLRNAGKQYFLLGALIIFLVFLIFFERKKSIKSILRLIITAGFLYFVYFKAIVNNINIILMTIIAIIVVPFINIFIKDGIHKKSFSELVSVILVSGITGVAITLIMAFSKTEAYYYDNVLEVNKLQNVTGIFFGISIITLIGVFMDTISKIIEKSDTEKDKAQDITWKTQFKEGIIIGRDLISEKVIMLFLIFAGITFYPICIYLQNGYTFVEVLNREFIFIIWTIAIVGNIGLILSVPITSFVYAMFNRKKTIYKTTSENKIDGKRSLKI